MNRQAGIIVTVITAVVFGCCGLVACVSGIGIVTGQGTVTGFSGIEEQIPLGYGVPLLCVAVLLLLIPVAVWYFLVRGKEDG